MFLFDEGLAIETLDFTFYMGSTPTFIYIYIYIYIDLYLDTAYAAYVYFTIVIKDLHKHGS